MRVRLTFEGYMINGMATAKKIFYVINKSKLSDLGNQIRTSSTITVSFKMNSQFGTYEHTSYFPDIFKKISTAAISPPTKPRV